MVCAIGRFGVWAPARVFDSQHSAMEAAECVEEQGYGALWVGGCRGELGLVSDMLGATTSLVLATGVLNIWADPAEFVSASYHRVASSYPGRLLLGLGVGHKERVESTLGQSYTRPYRKLTDYLDVLDTADYLVPGSERILGVLGPNALALAAKRASGAHPYHVTVEHTAGAREILGEGSLLAPEQAVVLEVEPDTARGIARRFLAPTLAMPNYRRSWRRLGFSDDDLANGGSDHLIDSLVAWGDPSRVTAHLARHLRAGADHVCIQIWNAEGSFPAAEVRLLADALHAVVSS